MTPPIAVAPIAATAAPVDGEETAMVRHVRDLHAAGIVLFAWSTAGADYARTAAVELGLEGCFHAFLPKPHVIIDDQAPSDWRRLIHVHPAEASTKTPQDYLAAPTRRSA